VTRFLAAAPVFAAPGRLRLVPVRANGQSAFAAYQREADGTYHAYAVTVPTVTATGIARVVTFFEPGLFGSFGLPAATPADPAGLSY
jgi:RNA polymerase sigma-70 factor (ECF subfamily)